MTYIAAEDSSDRVAKVIYQSKDAKTSKTFDALDWPRQRTAGCKHSPQLVIHIPNKGEQMVRYYGFYSNKSRGLRKKAGTDNIAPVLIDSDILRKAFRKNWARLIQKVYNIDPFEILGFFILDPPLSLLVFCPMYSVSPLDTFPQGISQTLQRQ